MTCRDCRDVADSFLNDELLTETNHEILQHLDACPYCRSEIGVRRQVRDSLRAAFNRAAELQPTTDFAERLRDQLRADAVDSTRAKPSLGRWLMLAAGMVLTAGVCGAVFMNQSHAPVDALARDAIGDHWNCALKNRKVRTPVPLEEAAERFDSVYRVLRTAPPDEVSTPNGPAQVVDRHSCAFGARRFGHVVLQYRQHVVSLLVTANDEGSGRVTLPPDLDPHLHGAPLSGLSVASIRGARHAILLVSDVEGRELQQLARTVSVPLVEQLLSGRRLPGPHAVAAFSPGLSFERLFRRDVASRVSLAAPREDGEANSERKEF